MGGTKYHLSFKISISKTLNLPFDIPENLFQTSLKPFLFTVSAEHSRNNGKNKVIKKTS